ncbi:Alkali-sensitive linkage protein 1 OS=Schizosaccharomyces pombe (strain 972 / ATCC 24843) GN=asl1 PE=1 SV=1 [Rhizoctonia solani AG-1 IB]|uniref:Alkali-sensitive linkage protein 1 n=1 Tax=Thanatephorus cucumeris (strain AG1-IB / isolate 7/3/14) TaxID=1108050 RepID=A0A0B7FCX5_THACB|nr:Alkali-sensitive linkage protein 1 OS=Schizosaccharomyces pombe (strain 972 / ATCC 24843) GN=asl1 PE=1 SV=1 [Rhizoctonia solani AG-1 IB]
MLCSRILYLYATLSALFLNSDTAAARALSHVRRQNTSTPLKAGLGWGGGGNISQFEGHEVSWYFTWSPQSWVTPPPTELEFVPQLWGQRDAQLFSSVVNATSIAANGWKNILGMNEYVFYSSDEPKRSDLEQTIDRPQIPDQANMSAQDGVNLWKTRLEPLKASGVRLGSPATASGPSGKIWMQDFFSLCAGACTVDFVALHWYGNIASEFIAYLEDFHSTFQRPIWVTEYSCQNFVNGAQCTYDEIVEFLNTTQTFMDQTPWVERYAWFGAMASLPDNVNNLTALMDPSGIINDLGRQYIGSPVTEPSPTTLSSVVPTPTTTSSVSPTTSRSESTTLSSTTVTSSSSQVSGLSSTSLTATPATTTSPYVIINNAVPKALCDRLLLGSGALISFLVSIA